MTNKYDGILSNTTSTIASDLEACLEGESLDAEMLAESAIDMVPMYGGDEELSDEFANLPFNEQMIYAVESAKYYV